MLALYCLLSQALRDRKGVTAVEYAVIAGVLVAIIATAFTSLGNGISSTLTTVVGKM